MAGGPQPVPGERDFVLFNAAFERAAERAGGVVRITLNIGGQRVALEFAGEALVERMAAPFAHLRAEGEAEIRFRCWESETTGVGLPPELDPLEVHRRSLPGMQREEATRWAHGRPDPGITGYHQESSTAVYWFPTSSGLTFGDLAGGLRSAITWSMAGRGLSFLHTAAVGWNGSSALIVGASGSGKSSTALTCLLEGMEFLGDDHCLVSRGPVPQVHAVYAAAKLHTEQMRRFPDLEKLIVNEHREPWDKAVAVLYPHFTEQLPRVRPVSCLLVPRIGESRETTVQSVSAGLALRALAPSTMLQMTAANSDGLHSMADLVRSVPCYLLTLGSDRACIAQTIKELLEEFSES